MLCLAFVVSNVARAQKFSVKTGGWKNLKGITLYDLEFDYSNLKVDKFETEEEFLKDKMGKREAKGTDDDFKASWFADRENRYEPKFIESFNKRFDDQEVAVAKDAEEAKYTLVIKTTWIYPGYNVGAWRQNSKINATLSVIDKANPSNILFSVVVDKAEGYGAAGYDYNSGYRISEAYAKLAKSFASYLKSKSK